jgi:hypothetical protein
LQPLAEKSIWQPVKLYVTDEQPVGSVGLNTPSNQTQSLPGRLVPLKLQGMSEQVALATVFVTVKSTCEETVTVAEAVKFVPASVCEFEGIVAVSVADGAAAVVTVAVIVNVVLAPAAIVPIDQTPVPDV